MPAPLPLPCRQRCQDATTDGRLVGAEHGLHPFETAFRQFQSTKKPFIFTYFKDAQISTGSANKKDLMSLWAFQEKLDALEHFYTRYENIDALKFHFNQQLDKLVATGFIEFQPDRDHTAADGLSTNEAALTGNGAIAQGPGATAVGAGGVSIGGNNAGTVNTGTRIDTGGGAYVGHSVNMGRGNFIGRDKIMQGIPADDLEPLIASLLAAVVQHVPADKQVAAVQKVRGLEAEAAKGAEANDSRLSRILDGLFEMVPGAIGAAVKMFASPILSGIAGPITQSVLNKWKGD